ncbi:hypothetical protein [Psychrobacter sp. AOP31-A1-22]|uniref:hypothetical protein n=1 Tax=Psychrobacter sp. AOP31-A1-22 TaxID=3457696 RepID=UPI004036F349
MSEAIKNRLSTLKQLFTGMGEGATLSRIEVKNIVFNQEFTPNFDTLDGKCLLKTIKGKAEVELLIKYHAGYSITYHFDYESSFQRINENSFSDKELFIKMIENGCWQANFFSKPDYRANSIMINNDCDETLIDDICSLSQLKNIDIQPTGKFEFLASRGDLVVSPDQRDNAEILMAMEAVLTKDNELASPISVELDKRVRDQMMVIIG